MLETALAPIWPLYSVLRVLIIFVSMVLFFVTIYAGTELFSMRPHFVYDPRKPAKKHAPKHAAPNPKDAWAKIRAKLQGEAPEAIRLAIIEADGFVDNSLKKRNYEGDTFADRLSKFPPGSMETLDRVWNAHRLRNDIVHTPGFHVAPDQAERALNDYEAFLKELGEL